MAVVFIEAGGAETGAAAGTMTDTPQTGSLYNGAKSGTTTIDTAVKEHGYSSIKCDATATPASAYVARLACLADAGRRVSIRMRFATAFGATAGTAILRFLTSAVGTCWEIRLDSAGKLRLHCGAAGATLVQTGATALSLGQWYRISVAYTITSATVNEFRVYLDGVLELTGSNIASQTTATSMLRIGFTGTAPAASAVINFQDVYIDDSTALTDPGNIRVTAKKPAAAGSTNAFDTLVGTGTNRWDRVSERPGNNANGLMQAGTGVVRENFTVEAEGAGVDNITGAPILDWAAWAYWTIVAAAGDATTALVANGTDIAQTSVAASGVYQMAYSLAGLTTYPSANNVVGYKSTGTAVDTTLTECGVIIAYKAASFMPPNRGNRNPMLRM